MKLRLLLFLFTACVIKAQVSTAQQFSISGLVKDEKGKAIALATVSVYKTVDSVLLTATATDDKGRFSVNLNAGVYYLAVTFLSFQEKKISNVTVDKNINLGTIVLQETVKQMSEIVVTSDKKMMELKLDKRIYNVSQDVSNIGANASEILANIPSVTVDPDGNVSLRGSEGVRILIDGKPSALTGLRSTDALRNLQGAMIERIEVITNPSSRYDAAGETGIINIILKKNKTRGFNGNFTGTVGYPSNFSGAYSINYRTQKMNLFSSFGSNYRQNPGNGSSTQKFSSADTSFMYNQTQNRTRRDFSLNFMAGIDYYISSNATFTGSFLIDGGRENNLNKLLYEDFNSIGSLTGSSERIDDETATERDTELSLNLTKKFPGEKEREWTTDFKWTNSGEKESSDYSQTFSDGTKPLSQRSGNPAYEDNLLLQTDYIHGFGKDGKFETGLKGTIRRITNEFLVEEQDVTGNWITLPAFDNNMEFTEQVYAVYGLLGNKIKDFSYQFGLRGELTIMRTGLIKTNEINDRRYANLFPSASISYAIDEKNTLQLSYSYRINRPNFRNLTPFADFSDDRVYFVGNPNLNPEFTHSMEAGHLLEWSSGSLLSGVYYRYKTGVVERIRTIDTVTGISNIIPVNLATQKELGIEMTFAVTAASWWKINSTVNFFRAVANGKYENTELNSETVSWTNRTTSRMTFFKDLDFQASVNYQSPRITTQGKTLAIYSIDLGLVKDVFKGKGTLTFNVRDLMNSRRRRTVVDIPGYYSNSDFLWRPRQMTLTLNFRINQQKIQRDDDDDNNNIDG
ncbi:TonB-dependent receptor [Lacibacter sediminis]|uniref:TonB-dependent receptor n=1 Tax=Lacibacter sediminis TaxID=2760713 RepID=A0A7G5XLQ3_9BACT|nr:TonB-dependent receptor [Lacibacter sediminis]QNA46406.1 TonB-dependent receptor [Lacibacter sediminis]